MALHEHYLLSKSRQSEAKLQWTAIYEIVDQPEYVYIFQTSRYALIVPKRFFVSLEQAQSFVDAAKAYKANTPLGLTMNDSPDEGVWPPTPSVTT